MALRETEALLLHRRTGGGDLSALFGARTLGFDRYLRVLGFRRLAEADWGMIGDEARAALTAYADGVNAFLASHQGAWPPEYALLRARPEPWLPVDPSHYRLAVDRQSASDRSILKNARRFIDFRKQRKALRLGDIAFVEAPATVLAFTRSLPGERLFCAFNFGDKYESVELPAGANRLLDFGRGAEHGNGALVLPPFGCAVLECET